MDLISETNEDQNVSESSSPLKSMSLTTDTLSLRQSHIGTNFPDSREMVTHYQRSIGLSQNLFTGDVQEIVPYPPDIISTTVERSTGTDWGYQSRTPLISNQKNKSNKSSDRMKIKRMSSQESVASNHFQDFNGFDKSSVISLNSFCSGIESNHSNDTNVLTIECTDASNQTKDVVMINEYIQVSINDDSTGPLFDLRRKLALESGKAEQLSHIMDEMVKERSDLQMKFHSIEKELKVKTEKISELNGERESLLSECEELKSGINKWESIVNEYVEVVDSKKIEIQALNEDIVKLNENNERVLINCEHLKIDLDSKDSAIKELNKKISQINIEINSCIQIKVSLEEEIKRRKAEIEEISSQRDWFELELNKLQVQLNETHQKLVSEQQLSITARNECERAQTLNAVLKQELIEVKHKTVKEKEGLMRHLEGIGAQLIQKQTEMQLLSPNNNDMVSSVEFNEVSTDLKHKLIEKDNEFEKLSQQLNRMSEYNQKLVNEYNSIEHKLSSTVKQSSDKDYEIQTLKSYNSDLELKIRGLNIDLKRQKELNEILRKDKKESESKLNALAIDNKTLESATKHLKETIEKHERSLKQLKSNLVAKETKLDSIDKEKTKLLNAIQIKEQELSHFTHNSANDPNDDQSLSLFELKIRNQELEKVMNNINSELRANQIRFDEQKNKLSSDCSLLTRQLAEEKHRSQQLMETNEKINEKTKSFENRIIELQTELNSILKLNNNKTEIDSEFETNSELIKLKNEKIRSLESNVKLLTKKYREVIESKKEMEEKLKNTSPVVENVTKILVSTQTEDFEEKCDHLELIRTTEELQRDVERLREEIQSKDSVIAENQKIILKLEHERGKLSSAGENSTNEHILSLEVLIASKSDEVIQLTEELKEKTNSFKELELKSYKKINEIETDLKKERAVVKDLRHSIFAEKRENNYLKKDLNEMKRSLTESNAIADKRKQELIDIENQMKNLKQIESSLRNDIERIGNELKITIEENTKLKNKIENSTKKNEPLLEQLRNLSLNLMEKNQEIEGLKCQFNSVRERYESEVQSLKQRIDSYENDSQTVTNELNELRKTNFSLESRLTELRVVLKNSCEQNKKLRQQLNACQVVVTQESAFNEELVTKLLDQTSDKKEIKPLVNLQACVESLKMEMQLLQKQISDHNN